MNTLLFDIYIWIPSIDNTTMLEDFERMKPEFHEKVFNHYLGVICNARFRYESMRCWITGENLIKVIRDSLCSLPLVFDGKHYFTWSEMNEHYDIVFQSYDKNNMIVYIAATLSELNMAEYEFIFNEKYKINMRPLLGNSGIDRIPNTHKVAIIPKNEFYRVVYEKALDIKNIFARIGYEKEFYINNVLDEAKKRMEELDII